MHPYRIKCIPTCQSDHVSRGNETGQTWQAQRQQCWLPQCDAELDETGLGHSNYIIHCQVYTRWQGRAQVDDDRACRGSNWAANRFVTISLAFITYALNYNRGPNHGSIFGSILSIQHHRRERRRQIRRVREHACWHKSARYEFSVSKIKVIGLCVRIIGFESTKDITVFYTDIRERAS